MDSIIESYNISVEQVNDLEDNNKKCELCNVMGTLKYNIKILRKSEVCIDPYFEQIRDVIKKLENIIKQNSNMIVNIKPDISQPDISNTMVDIKPDISNTMVDVKPDNKPCVKYMGNICKVSLEKEDLKD